MATAIDPQTPKLLLSLDTLVQRNFILIDGQACDIRNAEEFSLYERQRVMRLCERMRLIELLDSRTDEEDAEYESLVKSVVEAVLIAPLEVQDKLQRSHQEAICLTFTALLLSRLQPARATKAETAKRLRSTGVKSARGSRGSTGARRRTG